MCGAFSLWWRCPCAQISFLLLMVGDRDRDISGNVTTLMCAVILLRAWEDESYIGTNEWTVNLTFSPKVWTNCSWTAVDSLLGCFCGDATHSWWLTFHMSRAGPNAIMDLSRSCLYCSGVSELMRLISSLQTLPQFVPFIAYDSVDAGGLQI